MTNLYKVRTSNVISAGKVISVPTLRLDSVTLISRGKAWKTASILDEELVQGNPFPIVEQFLQIIKDSRFPADIISFAHRPLPADTVHPYEHTWDNYAAIPITTYDNWISKQICTDARQNVRKAPKRGIVTRVCDLNDDFLRGVSEIYNETPIRQGRPFWHYNKPLEQIRAEVDRYLDRSILIGAFYHDELAGFSKLTFTDAFADIGLIVSKLSHYDKRVMSALLAKAVEICSERGVRHLRYDRMSYGRKANSTLAEFKKRNGFIEFPYPRYYIPATLMGVLVLKIGAHRKVQDIVPEPIQHFLLSQRERLYRFKDNSYSPDRA
jgi:hypothetical protein